MTSSSRSIVLRNDLVGLSEINHAAEGFGVFAGEMRRDTRT